MRTLYLDCGMGAAGDMLTGALLELVPDPKDLVKRLNGLGIPGVKYVREKSVKCGIVGTHISVLVDGAEEGESSHGHEHGHEHEHDHHSTEEHAHTHTGLDEIRHLVQDHMTLPDEVRKDVLAVYGLLAEAESAVHGVPVEEIHFHEIGTKDALADITAVCLLMYELSPDEVVSSPVHVGAGHVRCAHGILPVPAPATARLLLGVPAYGGSIQGELCTPTGAALLKHFVTRFGDMPVLVPEKIGYGMGRKDFATANCVRAILGETQGREEEVFELSCQVDDMTGEEIAFAAERLFEGGALDVFTVQVGMKKGRPGILITVLCRNEDREKTVRLMMKHTSTIGIREKAVKRYVLDRKSETIETDLGTVSVKTSAGYGVVRKKVEYEDLARIARENGLGLSEARRLVEK
ncbi:MAG: nickel pincer cofactor biosynthesis protein LarC [Clostridia bacterium]|nr:nickel pincer cofactor biosynthesis protein LarC [Clostridia bacterium]